MTKFYGEEFVKEMTNRFFIVRSSWVYDNRTLLKVRQGVEQGALLLATDQVASPTSSAALAKFIAGLLQTYDFGTYHYTCKGECTRLEFITETARLLGLEEQFAKAEIHNLNSSIHPDYALLDNLMLRMLGWKRPPHWKEELADFIAEYLNGGGSHGS